MFAPTTAFNLRIRVAREINYSFENDRKQHKIDMKAKRKELKAEYWRLQT